MYQLALTIVLFCSPHESRQGTPVKSDTEYELNEREMERVDQEWQWSWGELPTPSGDRHSAPPSDIVIPLNTSAEGRNNPQEGSSSVGTLPNPDKGQFWSLSFF